jgi:hypothetical protein
MTENRFADAEAFASEATTDEPASPSPTPLDGLTDFDPVPLRYRSDGLTPQKQREFVEALADTGVVREAAARIDVSEQAINRARRRADARAFDLACEAAQRFGARRLRSIAFERAIEGTVKRHYYHGELKSEEVVYDNRLLIYLLGKTEHLLDPPEEADAVADNWEPFMDAMEQGLPPPVLSEVEGPVLGEAEEAEPARGPKAYPIGPDPEFDEKHGLSEMHVWMDPDGSWWTEFPPPAGFDGVSKGIPGGFEYQRTLSPPELALVEAAEAAELGEIVARDTARRDAYFGFEGGNLEPPVFSPREAETNETSAGARCAAEQRAGGQRPRERPADGSATPSPIDVTGQWSRDGRAPHD